MGTITLEPGSTGNPNLTGTSGSAHVLEQGQIGGGEGEDVVLTAQTRVTFNSNLTAYTSGSTTAQTVSASPSRLTGLIIPSTLVGTVTMSDDATAKFVLPSSFPVGAHNFPGIRFATNMNVTLSSTADDVYVAWWNIGTGGL